MKAPRIILGLVLIALGTLGLVYGGFSFTSERHDAKLGPLELSVKEREHIAVPQWLSVVAIAIGAVVLVAGRRR